MLDRCVWGDVSRISPEAPVPVVAVEKESLFAGGAGNVARNVVPFAHEVQMFGRIGRDRDGDILKGVLEDDGIDVGGLVESESFPTITKTRIIARQQQVVRIDHEMVGPVGDEEVGTLARLIGERIAHMDALIISDYGKGFVTQALVDELVRLARQASVIVTVDPNPNNPLNWKGVTSVKPNRSEAFREVGVPDATHRSDLHPLEDHSLLKIGSELLARWGTEMVHVTLGEQGMILFESGKPPYHIPAAARDVFDVSGAGDTAIALFTLALTAGVAPVEAARISNFASSCVVGKLGTAVLSPDELAEFVTLGHDSTS
jgi:D-beta-D-heptose 7-phosphate kinase/D-beta-D-heptose 1-phosphate adenosyltransferase